MRNIIAIIILTIALTGCYKAEYHKTSHPYSSEVTIDVASPTLPDGSTYSGDIVVIFDGQEYIVAASEEFTLPDRLEPGTYTYYIYSDPVSDSNISFSYDTEAGVLLATAVNENGEIESISEQIYFEANTVVVSADSEVSIVPEMQPLCRELNFKLALSGDAEDRLSAFSAEMNGVAQQWDCTNNSSYGSSASIEPSLSKTSYSVAETKSDDSQQSYLEGTIYLMGISSDDTQILSIKLSYEDGNPETQLFESDITALLYDFNSDKSEALTLFNSVETPQLSSSGGSISNWTTNNKEVDAK